MNSAALDFLQLDHTKVSYSGLTALHAWLDNWQGMGALTEGMLRQGFETDLAGGPDDLSVTLWKIRSIGVEASVVASDPTAGKRELIGRDSKEIPMAPSERHWQKIEAHLKQWAAELDRARLDAEQQVADVQSQYYQQLAALRADIEQTLRRWDMELKALKQRSGGTESEVARGIEDFRARLKAELSEWQPELEQLKRTAAQAKGEAKRMAEDLRARGKLATKRLAGLKQAAGESWDEVKPAIERAWAELRPALRSAAAKFREPQRPGSSAARNTEPGSHEARTAKN